MQNFAVIMKGPYKTTWKTFCRLGVLVVLWSILYVLFTHSLSSVLHRKHFKTLYTPKTFTETPQPSEQRTSPLAAPTLAISSITKSIRTTLTRLNLTLNTDSSMKTPVMEAVRRFAEKVPSVPLNYLKQTRGYKASRCASYPNFFDLHFNNHVWQQFDSPKDNGASFYIFGAYFDNRTLTSAPAVRVLVMINRVAPPGVVCQLWYGYSSVVAVPAKQYVFVWHKNWGDIRDGSLQPFLITCPIPAEWKMAPHSVSLVDNPCDNATNNVRVFYSKPLQKRAFAVCVKGLSFQEEDVSVRLVEWLELLFLLGADKVFFYELATHPNVSKVLEHYEKLGRVETRILTLPGNEPNYASLIDYFLQNKKVLKRKNEVIPYNDCFYKNVYSYRYVVLLDTDEIIMPLKDKTWNELIDRLDKDTNSALINASRGALYASNVYFFDDSVDAHGWFEEVPWYFHMLQHVHRARNHTKNGTFVKSFFNTDSVLALHNHLPIRCLGQRCRNFPIPKDIAHLQHYRQDCDASIKTLCTQDLHKNLVLDDNIWRFKDMLVANTQSVLRKLNFIIPSAEYK